ncbi:condensation domain-containing protein [Streptomyces sp. M19]
MPLSFEQERMWLTHRFRPTASSYHLPLRLGLTGQLLLPALRSALEQVLRRHEVLRTRYPVLDGSPVAEVRPAAEPVELPLVDLSGLPASARRAASRDQAAALALRPFDLTTGPVLRAVVFRLDRTEHELVLIRHHIAADGWSLGVLLTDLADLYRAHVAGHPPNSPNCRCSTGISPPGSGTARGARRRRAAGPVAGVARRRAGPAGTARQGVGPARRPGRRVLRSRLGDADVRGLRQLAGRRRTTLFSVLLTGYGLALANLSGQRDLVVGSPVASRARPELAGLVGCFVNLLPLRLDLSGTTGFGELLSRVREVVSQGLDDQEVPFERIVETVRPRRSLAETPLVQAAFAYQNTPAPRVELTGLTATVLPSPPVAAKFPLTMTVSPLPGGLELELSTTAPGCTARRRPRSWPGRRPCCAPPPRIRSRRSPRSPRPRPPSPFPPHPPLPRPRPFPPSPATRSPTGKPAVCTGRLSGSPPGSRTPWRSAAAVASSPTDNSTRGPTGSPPR